MKNKLKKARESMGLSQEKLAEISHVSRGTISSLENGKSYVVKTDTLVKLADALSCKVSDVFFN